MTAFTMIKPPVPHPFHSIIDQDMQGFMTCLKDKKENLDLILHTPGGDYEATKRIIHYLDTSFKHIRVFVPHLSFSGGTLLACAADEIYMGPYSSLGPTDPQVFVKDSFVPIGAIIEEFKNAFEEVSADPNKALLWNERLNQIPFGLLTAIQKREENSRIYLKELLKRRNCRNLDETKLNDLVKFLSEHGKHSSHGTGISFDEARKRGMNVIDLHSDKTLEDLVLSIYHIITIIFQKTDAQKIIINELGKKYINNFHS
jgi:hypothetical protein